MGCDPPEHGGDERFYLYLASVPIFGHTIDAWGRERYPEDVEGIEQARSLGQEFGCWHSVASPDGEFGFNPKFPLIDISYDQFMRARELGWDFNLWRAHRGL